MLLEKAKMPRKLKVLRKQTYYLSSPAEKPARAVLRAALVVVIAALVVWAGLGANIP